MASHRLSIMTTFREETKFLREWIEYHRIVGVEKFFLFCNDDPHEAGQAAVVLGPYVRAGLVEMQMYGDRGRDWQRNAWRQMIDRWHDQSLWFALIDVDEYLFPTREATLLPMLSRMEADSTVAKIAVHSCIFGDSGLRKSPRLQTQELLRRAPMGARVNHLHKYIVRPDRLDAEDEDCYRPMLPGFRMVDVEGEMMEDGYRRQGPKNGCVRLNHYSVRSREDWKQKVRRGWPRGPEDKKAFAAMKLEMLNRNDRSDKSMLRFGSALRAALGENTVVVGPGAGFGDGAGI